eukprot:5865131-Amphidinium_carterae.4
MTKPHDLGTFVKITEEEAVGYRKIKTRGQKGLRDQRTIALHHHLSGMRACLRRTANAGHGGSVCDISSAFLYADLPKEQALGETLGEIGYTWSELDPGVFYRGTPNGGSYGVVPKGFALCHEGKYAEQLQVLVGFGKESTNCQVPLTLADRDAGGGESLSEGDHERFMRAVGQLLWLAGDRPIREGSSLPGLKPYWLKQD